ncbi:hypothetical protein IAU60_003526 [Kwoniella sp. DSM 27419]
MPATKHNRNRGPRNPYKKPRPAPVEGEERPKPPVDLSHKVLPTENRSEGALPGLSKLKASIRQTKRLLAKDTLEPGLRVQTQRRLTSLEADLAAAEQREVEKKNGAKYHMVKFFDRQKLLRLVKRLHRKLAEEGKSDKKRAKLDEELDDARVMLNYVLSFPNAQKYISLFPSSANQEGKAAQSGDKEPKLSLPALIHPTPDVEQLDKPSKRRFELLQETKKLMEEGRLSKTPEEDVKKDRAGPTAGVKLGADAESKKAGKKEQADQEDKDDFFEDDD